jgi:hypothetical protein
MSAIGVQSQINSDRALWLSSIPTDVIHGNVICDTIIASAGYISTFFSDNTQISSLVASTLNITDSLNVSTVETSSFLTNFGKTSTLQWASADLSGVGYVNITTDVSGVKVTGDAIVFENLVYFLSTITLVPVSTIVDTDIFAQNGYFSTISTGSLSTNLAKISSLRVEDLSANYGAFDTLYVSSLEALDISGVAASNWSQYPTQNSSIIFQPGFVLSNVNNLLFFAGVELTDVSGGGQDWANFPALSSVQVNNQVVTGISTLRFQDAATLTSITGNNLYYNGQPVQYGAASNVSQWANYTAVNNVNMNTSSLLNVGNIGASNLALSGSNITNGNTFTNSLGVGGTSLISLASITSGGDVTCRNLTVGDSITSLADVEIYGATALPGDSALYVAGGVQFDGGTIHGFSAGLLPVAGINTGRIDMLQAGFNLLHPLVGAITTGTALGITAGGALSLAAGSYIETNTDELRMTNSTSGNKQTTLTVGNILSPPDIAATSSLTIQNIAGGGIEIQAGGQGSITGFSTIQGSNVSSINLDVSTINGIDWQDISGGVFTTTSTFTTLFASSFTASSIKGIGGFPVLLESPLEFATPSGFINVDVINTNLANPLTIQASTIELATYNTFTQSLSTQRLFAESLRASSFISQSDFISSLTVSSISAQGGLPIVFTNFLRFSPFSGIDNVDVINTNPFGIPQLALGGSTINLITNNTRTNSLSTVNHSTSALSFGSATTTGSNATFQFPLIIDYDQAQNFSTGGVAMLIKGHNLPAAAVQQLLLGVTGGGQSLINSSWPGQGLEDLIIEARDTIIRNDTISTIFGSNNFGLQTNAPIQAPIINTSSILFSTLSGATNFIPTAQAQPVLRYSYTPPAGFPASNAGFPEIQIAGSIGGAGVELKMGVDLRQGVSYVWSDGPTGSMPLEIYGNQFNFQTDGAVSLLLIDEATTQISSSVPMFTPSLYASTLMASTLMAVQASTGALTVSSINNYAALPAYASMYQTSSMRLYQNSTTLAFWNAVPIEDNITVSGYDVTIDVPGTYKIGASYQVSNTSGTDKFTYFFLKNNVPIDYTASFASVANNIEQVEYSEILETLTVGDTIQFGVATGSADVFLSTFSGVVSSPAVIGTIYKVS